MVPNNSTKFEIRSQVLSGNHWGRTEGWTDTYTSNRSMGITKYLVTKPTAELEINIDVTYVGEDERTDG